MTISKDLFLALLSMDSYNRGYGSGISDAGEDDPDGLGGPGSLIGNAIVIQQSGTAENDPERAAGFYGVSYKITDGSGIEGLNTGDTVISYRGTEYCNKTHLPEGRHPWACPKDLLQLQQRQWG